jgi:chromosome condensin MukBEF ATPase and DNA-binding subunit MukB
MIKIKNRYKIPAAGVHYELLTEFVSTLPSNASILEVGVYFGRSSWSILDGMLPNMTLTVVDNFLIDMESAWAGERNSLPAIRYDDLEKAKFEHYAKRLTHFGMYEQIIDQHPKRKQLVKIFDFETDQYTRQSLPKKYDMVFLDGWHAHETVRLEVNYFRDSPLIILHDYGNEYLPTVQDAVDEFITENPDKELTVYANETIAVIRDKIDK